MQSPKIAQDNSDHFCSPEGPNWEGGGSCDCKPFDHREGVCTCMSWCVHRWPVGKRDSAVMTIIHGGRVGQLHQQRPWWGDPGRNRSGISLLQQRHFSIPTAKRKIRPWRLWHDQNWKHPWLLPEWGHTAMLHPLLQFSESHLRRSATLTCQDILDSNDSPLMLFLSILFVTVTKALWDSFIASLLYNEMFSPFPILIQTSKNIRKTRRKDRACKLCPFYIHSGGRLLKLWPCLSGVMCTLQTQSTTTFPCFTGHFNIKGCFSSPHKILLLHPL